MTIGGQAAGRRPALGGLVLLLPLLLIGATAANVANVANEETTMSNDTTTPVAEIETSKGTLVLEFFPDSAPKHVENFTKLAKDGFYDGLTFHRVIPGFMIQGGCPRGDGTGGPGHKVAAEFNDRAHERGALSMARAAHPDSAGSQFFIVHEKAPHLDGQYTNFGQLLQGYDVLDAIAKVGDNSGIPAETVKMTKVTIRDRTDGDVREGDG